MNKGKDKAAKLRKSSGKDNDDLEDFEQMPTFTIVNINDIMNQKGDDAVQLRKRKHHGKHKEVEISSEEGQDDPDDISDNDSPTSKTFNRRKAQHTKILSDKLTKNSSNSKITGSRFSQQLKNQTPKVPLTGSNNNGRFKDGLNKPAILRSGPPPRILNSSLCKPSKSPALVTKLVATSDEHKQNNNTISTYGRSKENNVTSYTYTEKDGKLVPKKPIISPVKRIGVSPPSVRQIVRGGVPMPIQLPSTTTDRRVKKITCFETWHVLKSPESKRVNHKAISMVNLLTLGNNINELQLPSDEWAYKIVLQQVNNKQIRPFVKIEPEDSENSKTADSSADSANENEVEVYTGEIHDQNISEKDKHLYTPNTILFRRKIQSPNQNQQRIQFDRTVVFKNRTFLINMEGKNVRLITAPKYIHSFDDIEILLQIVNDLDLNCVDVELVG